MAAISTQRRQQILAEVLEKEHVTARDLALALDVSEATVRRDLRALSDEGQLDLVYGGATPPRHSDYSFRSKSQRNIEAKRIIGRLAAELVGDNDQIFLDSGTTCFEMVPFLKRRRGLSIIVNSARFALELDSPGLSVILVGGQYHCDRMDTVGPLAASVLDQLRGFVSFIGADGLSMDFGPAAADIESAHFNRQALMNSRQAVLVVDHTKFQSPSLFKIVDWDRIAHLVTDRPPTADWCEFLRSKNIQITCSQDRFTAEDAESAEAK